MNMQRNSIFSVFDKVLPWIFLAIMVFYTYAKFFGHPYGIRWDEDGTIVRVFQEQPEPTFKEGDRILQIGDVTSNEFSQDLSETFFKGAKPGDIVPGTVERDGRTIHINWVYPGRINTVEFSDQFFSEWFLAYFFWLAGVLTVLFVRPKDDTWLLMGLFNFLTGVWVIAGSGVSSFHVGYSAIVLRVVIWLCLPVYLHLHWIFPHPLGKLPRWLIGMGYAVGILFAIAQVFQLVPNNLYLFGFLTAVGGSFILFFIHLWRQPAVRRDFRLPLLTLALAVLPGLIWAGLESTVGLPAVWGSIGIITLPLLPLAYLYTAFRRRLGGFELRVNRFFTVYLFIILLGVIGIPWIVLADYNLKDIPNESLLISSAAAILTTVLCLWGYPVFERFMDRYILGIPVTSKRLLEVFSTHITTSVSVPDLIRVLREEVFPSLLIRQFAFLHHDQESLQVLSTMGLGQESIPADMSELTAQAGHYRLPELADVDPAHSWIRLILPLKLGNQIIGFWLFGRRDPDDLYSQQEIPTLTSLANLTAIALSNILQTERLTSMYQADINRYEEERVSLARDLHDSILNELAALPIRSDAPIFSTAFHKAYDAISDHLREIIRGLRPSMLSFGLKLALEDYAENLKERNPESVEIQTDIHADGNCRYSLMIESNVYRIVQEACENSLRYAHAKHLSISGTLAENQIELQIADDGVGLDPGTSLRFNDLLTHRHFGLAGMHERASVIGAELHISSNPGEGTQIQLMWKLKEMA